MGEIAVPQRLFRNPNNVITDPHDLLVVQNEMSCIWRFDGYLAITETDYLPGSCLDDPQHAISE
jgi:hypothetical protein